MSNQVELKNDEIKTHFCNRYYPTLTFRSDILFLYPIEFYCFD